VSPKPSPRPDPERSAPAHWRRETARARADRALSARYHDERDPVDREMLVERFLPLARQLASRYRGSPEPFDDLFQVACLGLVKAIDRFEGQRGTAFSSFAVPTILGELKRYFRDRTWSVRVPRDLKELSLRVDGAVADLTVALQRQPTIAEIAASVGASDEEVLEAREAAGAHMAASLNAPRGGGADASGTLGDTVSSDDTRLRRAEDRATLAHLMRRITPREREILCLRFLGDLTQAEIGQRIGLSQMQVSRIIRQALTRLQASTGARDEQPLAA
jgi:RNA polymerase sigma-B factor